jgi:hypothetical protein
MFFVLSKLLGDFAFPSNVTVLIGILGLLLLLLPNARAPFRDRDGAGALSGSIAVDSEGQTAPA